MPKPDRDAGSTGKPLPRQGKEVVFRHTQPPEGPLRGSTPDRVILDEVSAAPTAHPGVDSAADLRIELQRLSAALHEAEARGMEVSRRASELALQLDNARTLHASEQHTADRKAQMLQQTIEQQRQRIAWLETELDEA